MADLALQARLTVVCRTRLVTSLTPRSRLLVSDLVLTALARVGVADRLRAYRSRPRVVLRYALPW